jgi:deoxycytidylate deaminase
VEKNKIVDVLSETRIKQLIEFSRAVHAEMNAIISVSRNKNATTTNSKMYCTTFPCHSCARHIVAAGIIEVIYIEPYAKSLATELHDDSISTNSSDLSKVRFVPYQGVSPARYLNFFGMKTERKNKDGKLIQIDVKKLNRKDSLKLDDFLENEKKVIKESEKLIRIFTQNKK